jgi:hypothetical protein
MKVTWPSLTVTLIGHRIEHMKHMLYTVFSMFFTSSNLIGMNRSLMDVSGQLRLKKPFRR